MAATDSVQIIRIETGEAVKSVNDLRENIKTLKSRLGDLEIGTSEYQDTLDKLNVNQRALKDAMYATSSSMEEVASNAKGINVVFDEQNNLINTENQSYNALVNTMSELKTAWRATADEQKRAELGEQIRQVNDRLKEFDASIGNYQRNVGNYESALNNLHNVVKDLPPSMNALKKPLDVVDKSMHLIAVNPIIGTISLISPLLNTITKELQDNETSMGAVKRMMDALQPVFNLARKTIETLANWISKAVDGFVKLAGESGESFKKIVAGAVGVGNVLKEFIALPIHQCITLVGGLGESFKNLIKGDFKSAANSAKGILSGMGANIKNAFSFKANFEVGKSVGESFASGLSSTKQKVAESATSVEKAATNALQSETEKAFTAGQKKIADELKWRDAQQKEIDAIVLADEQSLVDSLDDLWDGYIESQEERKLKEEEIMKARVETLYSVADTTSSVLGMIADLYEADEENAIKNANKIKALQIASATIDTISGGISAFMSVWKDTGLSSVKTILAPIRAAAVVAAGMGNIAKIKSTNVKNGSASVSPSAIVTAPSVPMDIPQVRSVTTASEEDRLNQMANDSRVVLVMSDLEVKQNQQRVSLAEASF